MKLNILIQNRYEEVHHEVYATTTFSLNGDDLEAAHRFLGSIGPKGRSALKSLNIHLNAKWPIYLSGSDCNYRGVQLNPSYEERKWENIVHMLSTVCRLQSLYIKIYDRGFILPEVILLESLQNLDVPNFVVQLVSNDIRSPLIFIQITISKRYCLWRDTFSKRPQCLSLSFGCTNVHIAVELCISNRERDYTSTLPKTTSIHDRRIRRTILQLQVSATWNGFHGDHRKLEQLAESWAARNASEKYHRWSDLCHGPARHFCVRGRTTDKKTRNEAGQKDISELSK